MSLGLLLRLLARGCFLSAEAVKLVQFGVRSATAGARKQLFPARGHPGTGHQGAAKEGAWFQVGGGAPGVADGKLAARCAGRTATTH